MNEFIHSFIHSFPKLVWLLGASWSQDGPKTPPDLYKRPPGSDLGRFRFHFNRFLNDLVDEKEIIAVNKSDLVAEKLDDKIKKYNPIIISIKDEKNLDKLISSIKESLKNKFITSEDILITRARHRENLEQCLNHLKNFEEKNEQKDFDKAAEDLRLATRHLGVIVGKVDVEEILGSIFSDFCIGK